MALIMISKNDWYRLRVDTGKNRVHLKIIGRWNDVNDVPHYKEDWKKALGLTLSNFTVFVDASELKVSPSAVKALLVETQRLIINAGVSRTAELVHDELTELQLDAIARRTRFPKKNFYIKHEALLWLDEVGHHSAIDSRTVAGSSAGNIVNLFIREGREKRSRDFSRYEQH